MACVSDHGISEIFSVRSLNLFVLLFYLLGYDHNVAQYLANTDGAPVDEPWGGFIMREVGRVGPLLRAWAR